eukprot:scaffold140329_cov133-Phaeocystis_antarctica.AAC.1
MGVIACCAGPFAYTKDTITLKATVLIVLRAEMSGTFYHMATKDNNACKTARPNWIQNDLRKMVIAGKIEICIGFCFPIISGNLFMVPEVALPVTQRLKHSGQCCLLVSALISRDSCAHCPSGDRYQMTPYWVPPYPEATGHWFWTGPCFGPFQVEMFGAAGRRPSAPRTRFNSAQPAPCTRVPVVRIDCGLGLITNDNNTA